MSQNNCQCSRCRNSNRDEEVRVHPTRHEVRHSKSVKTVKKHSSN